MQVAAIDSKPNSNHGKSNLRAAATHIIAQIHPAAQGVSMTNSMIVLQESIRLMNDGKIGTTGRTFKAIMPDGSTEIMQEPEAIHTFAVWKSLGFMVRKGEKAVAKFPIWKYTSRPVKDENGEQAIDPLTGDPATADNMFMQRAAWFSASQVEPMQDAAAVGA